jgi:hypothetical protein
MEGSRAMFPQVVWTVLAITLAAGSALGAAVLGLTCRRQRAALAEAEARLDALAGRIARLEVREAAPGPVVAASPAPAPAAAPRAQRREPIRRIEPAAATAVAGPTLIAVPNLAAATVAGESGPAGLASTELGRRFGAIWELADAGVAAEAIARAAGQPIGQVELILGLKRQLTAAGAGDGAGPAETGGPGTS